MKSISLEKASQHVFITDELMADDEMAIRVLVGRGIAAAAEYYGKKRYEERHECDLYLKMI